MGLERAGNNAQNVDGKTVYGELYGRHDPRQCPYLPITRTRWKCENKKQLNLNEMKTASFTLIEKTAV